MLTKRFALFFSQLSVLALLLTLSLGSHAKILPEMVEPAVGQTYYTRYNFMYEKGRHVTTNYWRGELVPFNTKVVLVSMDSKKLVLDIDGVEVTILNVKKHTQRDAETIASELLSPTKISLKGISKELQNDMLSGNMRLGMTKEQVLMTRGYPPQHKTSSTKANTWTYWSSKFVQQTIVFQDDKLSRGRGLY